MSDTFQVKAKNIGDLFRLSSDRPCLHVPHYQRPYCWKAKEIGTLIDDIDQASKNPEREYFIGPITVLMNLDNDRHEVIDGQQRLTTICLIIDTLNRQLLGSKIFEVRGEANTALLKRQNEEDERDEPILCHHRISDREAFRYELKFEKNSTGKTKINEAARFIRKKFESFEEEQLVDFFRYITRKVICIHVECMEDAVSYQIFETLNERGKGLSPLDLIRNRLFSHMKQGRRLDEAIEKVNNLEQRMKGVPGGSQFAHIQNIFSIYLSIKRNHWIEPKELFDHLKKFLEEDRTKSSQIAAEIIDFVTSDKTIVAYLRIANPNCTGNEPSLSRVLQDFHHYQVLKPLLFAITFADFSTSSATKAVKMGGALIKRTQIFGKPLFQYGDLFTRFANWLSIQTEAQRNVDEALTLNRLKQKIFEFDKGPSGKLVCDDQQFQRQIIAQSDVNETQAKDFFLSFYNELHFNEEGLFLTLKRNPQLHIEHILPQTFHKQNWGKNFSLEEQSILYRKLGNLMLLSGPRNKEVDRLPFKQKLQIYKDEKEGEITNPLWCVSFLDDCEEWTKGAIEARQRVIAEKMIQLWSFAP